MASSSYKPPPRTIVYTRTSKGVVMVPLLDQESKDEEAAVEYRKGGYLPISIDDKFAQGRYVVVRKLGWGHFSTVWLVKDTVEQRHRALKAVKSAERYTETARDEIKLLRQIASTDPTNPSQDHIVKLYDSFDHPSRGDLHICMIMEPLGETLLTLIERNRKTGLSRDLVRSVTQQILQGLEFLHCKCDLVHTDIKPENILIAIPDVEEHIRNELLNAPPPRSRHVGIPIEIRKATHPSSRRADRNRERVRIFDSQPLPSPSTTRSPSSRSPVEQIGRMISKLKHGDSPASTSAGNSLATSFNGSSTAPTSLSSNASKLLSQSQASITELLTGDKLISRILAPRQSQGPSLLSLTAPMSSESGEVGPSTDQEEISLAIPIPKTQEPIQIPDPSTPVQSGVFLSPPHLPELPKLSEESPLWVKIADLGNASPSTKHFTEDIQTRQYRCPEAILGRDDWNCKADIWSVGCLVFELLTGDVLFDPQDRSHQFTKDDDHMAMILELLADDFEFDHEFKMGGKYSADIFDSKGNLRHIKDLHKWPLRRVMVEKYLYQPGDAQALCDFILPMLAINPKDRASATDLLAHEWLLDSL